MKRFRAALLYVIPLAFLTPGQATGQTTPVSLTGYDAHSTVVPPAIPSTSLTFTLDATTLGNELFDILTSDSGVIVSITMPGGGAVTATNASSLGFQYFQQSIDANSTDGTTFLDIAGNKVQQAEI